MRLALLEDRLEEGARLSLPSAPRVLYVVSGRVVVEGDGSRVFLADDHAWHGTSAVVVHTERTARLWRWELRREDGATEAHDPALRTTVKLSHAIDLPSGGALMRADRVDFPPRGIAYTHTHQGPGIRVLLEGRFRVDTNGHTMVVAPGEAWFERGPDPVYAESTADEPTSFVRVMVLPVALLGKSSIRYVKPEDQARPKSQRYTVLVDAPLEEAG
ncbi:MAG: cupin domain-containing protein [Candidatus Rokubacteria bacterium]|nr:cupin domain-containing protein [Candidatus Rokubacteria bacterium]